MPEPEMNANGNVMVEALTPENVKGSSEGSIKRRWPHHAYE